ncbi:MAG: acyl-CoA thioesterase [Verrucomicrobiae bacterium]|nr:acyl-CoA thioesterase [Verrucomicrobiae bacterium]MCB1090255.1 acyl-CoA thioesterase [Verrucomicrobiae bacterium]
MSEEVATDSSGGGEARERVFSTFETLLAVRPDDIDMNQHVHNSKYFDYVLAARYDQMERCYGMSMGAFLKRGFSWVVKAAYIEHKRPLLMGDTVTIRTRVTEIHIRGVKVGFDIVKNDDGKLSAKGWLDYVMVHADTGRPAIIPEDILEKYSV